MNVASGLRQVMTSPAAFSETLLPDYRFRPYQAEVADQLARAMSPDQRSTAREFAAVFSRQAGKDELLAQLCAWLLVRHSRSGGQIVIALPTFDPQGLIARDRLIARLQSRRVQALGATPRIRDGRVVQVGRATAHFVSASPTANARGLTASLLLVANEAQDIDPQRWDAVFAPMAASTNAPTLFMGTIWTSDTLLSRQLEHFRQLEQRDDLRRRYLVTWRTVARDLPAYGAYVERQIAALGADHPFIRSEYELIPLDGDGGLFPPSRQSQMRGDHAPLLRARADETYALLLDVAGEEEDAADPGKPYRADAKRDSTALTVVRVLTGEAMPRYEVVRRYLWTGVRHTALHSQIVDLARNVWRASALVVDSTGIGAGLGSFLRETLGNRIVIPFVFSQSSKSKLGWDFLGLIDSGRFKDYATDGTRASDLESTELARIYWRQVEACRYQVRPGPDRLLTWSVPDARTHDDLLISAALAARLDEHDWRSRMARGR
ncbi:MAG: hypothetical protein EA415_00600 [Sphaerobacteraceae bacterium]|nr:MAG: hypothetical protein EA415_00600 [Sphaerobacteraceae bacterium]